MTRIETRRHLSGSTLRWILGAIVLVDAPEPVRLGRLSQHRGLAATEAARLIAAQLPSGEKRARADFIIDNDGSPDLLRERAWQVFRKLMSRARARA
mgnify:CR=1 FL=1